MMNDITAQKGRENRDFTTNIENESITSDTTTEKQRKQHTDPDIDQEWLENMKARWSKNYDKYKDKPLREREFLTKMDRDISENDLKIVDKLVNNFMDCLKWLLAKLYAVGPAGYQIWRVLMDAS